MAEHIWGCVAIGSVFEFCEIGNTCLILAEWRDCQNCKVHPAFAGTKKERDKQIEHFAALSRCWKGWFELQLNVKQRDLKAQRKWIEFDSDLFTHSPIQAIKWSSSRLVPLQSLNALRVEWPQGTMKDHERPKVMVNGHDWQWMIINGAGACHELVTYHPIPSLTSP